MEVEGSHKFSYEFILIDIFRSASCLINLMDRISSNIYIL